MKFNMQSMLSQAQKLQSEMEKTKNELSQIIVNAEAGAGMVRVDMTCSNEIVKVKINKDIIEMNDIEMLEDLIVAATNKAIKLAAERSSEEMNKVTGMLQNIPGFNMNL